MLRKLNNEYSKVSFKENRSSVRDQLKNFLSFYKNGIDDYVRVHNLMVRQLKKLAGEKHERIDGNVLLEDFELNLSFDILEKIH